MIATITFQCDRCLNDIDIEVEGANIKELNKAMTTKSIRDYLTRKGWHIFSSCLCPECKTKVGENNCMNCTHMEYKDCNYRCRRNTSNKSNIITYTDSVVTKYDTCKYFKKTNN